MMSILIIFNEQMTHKPNVARVLLYVVARVYIVYSIVYIVACDSQCSIST